MKGQMANKTHLTGQSSALKPIENGKEKAVEDGSCGACTAVSASWEAAFTSERMQANNA